jgi:DNA-binding beta-propeller fold protein YncE
VPVGEAPAGIALAHDGRHAFIATPAAHAVSVLDVAALRNSAQIAFPGEVLARAADPRRDRVYVADW